MFIIFFIINSFLPAFSWNLSLKIYLRECTPLCIFWRRTFRYRYNNRKVIILCRQIGNCNRCVIRRDIGNCRSILISRIRKSQQGSWVARVITLRCGHGWVARVITVWCGHGSGTRHYWRRVNCCSRNLTTGKSLLVPMPPTEID